MREIGGYLLERPLGAGGVGSVFRGIPRGGGTAVALKVVPGELLNEHVAGSFAREAAVAQDIRHPNLAAVLGFGKTDDGGLYLVMELLEGEDLDTRLGRGTLDPVEVVRVGTDAAAGLAAAHAAGVLHRDVKPSNIYLCTDGTVKVVDFGLAVRVQEVASARMQGQPPLVVGTPGYMAVEQARGQHDEDVRTDVWGLGATLYDALVGRPPFDAPTAMAQLVRMVSEEPDPFPAHVPEWLGRVILRALRKAKADRWPTMTAFADALRRGLERSRVRDVHVELPAAARRDLAPIALGDEVRIVSVVLAEHVDDFGGFAAAVDAEGGTASPLLGGRAVGLFGGESWRGDEAERAVRAALAIRALGDETQIGVATGRGLRTRPGEVTGAVVARAQAVLTLEGVGADAETLRRIRGGFEVDADTVLGRRAGAPILGVEGPGGADVPLVGRDPELAALRVAFDQAAEDGGAQAVLVTGPAGIGKTRLLHALLGELTTRPARPTVLLGRGEANRTLQGWHAIGSALRLYAELPEGTAPEVARERLLGVCPSRTCAEFLGEILGAGFPETVHLRTARADPGVMRDQVTIAVGDLLEAMTDAHPVVLALEDLHLADRPSVDLVRVVLRRLADRRLLLVATARPEGELPASGLRRLALDNLDREALGALVRAVLGDDARATRHAEAIWERTAGHPFFAQELALALLGQPDAEREGPAELPASVEAAVQARLDALPRPERDLLRRASVLGRRFWEEALLALGEADAEAALGRLRMHDLVAREPRSRLSGMTEWRFAHALVHEVAYASLTDEQRKHLHGGVARWLARRADANASEIARHFELAADPESASSFWLTAAEAAMREGDAPLALEASGRALSRRELAREVAFSLRLLRVDLFYFRGKKSEEEVEIEELGKLASSPSQEAVVHERWARHLRLRGRYFQAASVVRTGLRLEPRSPWLLVQDALLKADAGHAESAREAAAEAVVAALGSADPLAIGRAHAALAHCHVIQGDVGAALPLERRALTAYEEAGDPRRIATAHGNLAYYLLALGRYDEAVRGLERAAVLSRTAGNRSAEGYSLHNLGLARARAGAIDEGLADEAAALAIAKEVQEPRLELACLQYRAAILLEARRSDEALPILEEALRTPEDLQGNLAPQLRGLYASALVATGRLEEARAAAKQALDLRDAAGGMSEFEADLFVAAHEAGIPGALERGKEALEARAARISDPEARRSFLERVPAHLRLEWLARSTVAAG